METQPGYQGFSPSSYGAASMPQPTAPPPAQPPMMRPLSTGEILDRTLALYRRHFWLFVGIGTVPAAVVALSTGLRLLFLNTYIKFPSPTAGNPRAASQAVGAAALLQVEFLPALLLILVTYGIAQAATVRAVQELSLGTLPTAAEAYGAIRDRWLRWTGIVLRQLWSAAWPMSVGVLLVMIALLLPGGANAHPAAFVSLVLLAWLLIIAGLVLGVLNYLHVALAPAAGVMENLGVNASLRRSRTLVSGRKGRIFLALLLVYVLHMVAGGLQLPFALLAGTMHGAQRILLLAADLLIAFVATALVSPVASIALAMFYTDERVRREGYDIELLLQRSIAERAEAGA
ncbi:hypothetical protein [Terriglobus roseus]|uniref:DUF7847 domain-containing protein n=1 Tax=Terriglobus roseus TaxID=392734 RepID=A0A1G7FC98_9BACT|nr:hypothetical protein [Terriglobus roseus]SDE73105.1 hypothetical protein SAMN05444167_0281 [Terriglobus roseus]